MLLSLSHTYLDVLARRRILSVGVGGHGWYLCGDPWPPQEPSVLPACGLCCGGGWVVRADFPGRAAATHTRTASTEISIVIDIDTRTVSGGTYGSIERLIE